MNSITNYCRFIGTLVADPELEELETTSVVTFTLAIYEYIKEKDSYSGSRRKKKIVHWKKPRRRVKKHINSVLVLISDMNNLNKTVFILMASFGVLFAASAPTPPVIPEVQAVSSNEQIILMWDDKAESSIDPLTGYSDFEGYRIYRSTDGGQTWGKSWNRIYDYFGNHVAWEPFVQFDLIEESDSLHCVYNNGYLWESGELCYSNAIPYNTFPKALFDEKA